MHLDPATLLRRATTAARRTLGPGAEVRDLRPLEGGVSSLTYAAVLSGSTQDGPVVLKAAPPGLPPVRNRDVLRQARILRTLASVDGVPVPGVLFEDAGDPPGVPPLFAMELSPGEAYEPRLDVAAEPPSPPVAAERMRVAARTLARLHDASLPALGLRHEPVLGPGEELERWQRLLATVGPDLAHGHDDLGRRLADDVPRSTAHVVVHGDYRLANMLFDGPRLRAVIDWEIWSVGDPRHDLAWLLLHTAPVHGFHARRPPADVEAGAALPAVAELLAEYAAARGPAADAGGVPDAGTDPGGVAWFTALCHYKIVSTVAAIAKRELRAPRPSARVVHAASLLDDVLAAGHAALDAR